MGEICWDWGDAKATKSGETQLKSPWSTRSNRSYLARASALAGSGGAAPNILFQVEVLEFAQALLFRLPDAVDDILYAQHEVGLTVARVAEWHVRRVGLGNRGQ